jgi:hypothetical protein
MTMDELTGLPFRVSGVGSTQSAGISLTGVMGRLAVIARVMVVFDVDDMARVEVTSIVIDTTVDWSTSGQPMALISPASAATDC